jgi:predicted dehydrogenase
MKGKLERRRFLAGAVATGALTIVPRHILGGAGYVPPSEKITLAHIGMGTQSFSELGGLLDDPEIQIVAVCDPNTDSSDYVEWGKHGIRNRIREYLGDASWREGDDGCPGGREVGRLVVDTYYSKRRGGEKFKACSAYADFRELLEKEKDLDAVKVMTPDHLHATVSVAAMRKGLHALMHKPIANRMSEGRLVLETARKAKVATHLLAWGSGTGNGRIAAKIREGAIGALREIHNWTNRPVWPQYTEIPKDAPPVPKGFDWDLWLGPAEYRPYHPHYTHTVFRGWYDFGGGSMADMGIYSLWPVFTTLGLGAPSSAEAWATHTCEIVGNVSRPARNDFAYPTASTLRFQFAAKGGMPALELFWYDGGMRPRLPEALEAQGVRLDREGILFVGEKGMVLAGFNGQGPRLFAGGKSEPFQLGEEPSGEGGGGRRGGDRQSPWVRAAKGGEPSPGSFLNAGGITDTVNLGTIALRSAEKVLFDSEGMKITNVPSANRYLTREYRKGWEL